MRKLIKVTPDKDCKSCGEHPGVAISFFGGLPIICSCIQKQISVDGKRNLYDYIEENTKKENDTHTQDKF